MPARKTKRGVVTLETLTAGCVAQGIAIPKGATEAKLRGLIERELSKSEEYGGFCCEDCGADLIFTGLDSCPFCGAEYIYTAAAEGGEDYTEEAPEYEESQEGEDAGEEEGVEEEEVEEAEYTEDEDGEGEEPEYSVDPDGEEAVEWGEDGGVANARYVDDGDNPVVYDASGNGWSVTDEGLVPYGEHSEDVDVEEAPEEEYAEEEYGDEVPEEEEPEEAPPVRKPRAPAAKAAAKAKEDDRAAKRAKIEEELPYTSEELVEFKRPTLVMVAGILGIKDPAKKGGNDELSALILKAQARKFGAPAAKVAPAPKKKAAPPARKAAPAAPVRKVAPVAPVRKPAPKKAAPPARRPAPRRK